jgi:glucose dehydrogenase
MKLWALVLPGAIGLIAIAADPDYKDPKTWLTYAKNAAGYRYSDLAQINTANVQRLAPNRYRKTQMAFSVHPA